MKAMRDDHPFAVEDWMNSVVLLGDISLSHVEPGWPERTAASQAVLDILPDLSIYAVAVYHRQAWADADKNVAWNSEHERAGLIAQSRSYAAAIQKATDLLIAAARETVPPPYLPTAALRRDAVSLHLAALDASLFADEPQLAYKHYTCRPAVMAGLELAKQANRLKRILTIT